MVQPDSMTCEEFISLATDAADDGMGPREAASFAAHRAACASCARYDRVLKRGLSLVRDVPEVRPEPDFMLNLHRRLRAVDEEMLQRQRSASSGVLVAFAMAGLVAFAAWSPLLIEMTSRAAVQADAASVEPGEFVPVTDADEWRAAPWDNWYGYSAPSFQTQGLIGSFPGPYEPLIIQPPDVGRGGAVLTSLLGE